MAPRPLLVGGMQRTARANKESPQISCWAKSWRLICVRGLSGDCRVSEFGTLLIWAPHPSGVIFYEHQDPASPAYRC